MAAAAVPLWLRRIFWANLVAQCLIVVTGAIVRLTGSGLGCPTWPDCTEGSLVPTAAQVEAQVHIWIEFGNRLLTFVLTALAIAALVGALVAVVRGRRGRSPRLPRGVLPLAAIPLVGTVVQAVIGGITVLTGLHPAIVGAHFLVSIAIIAGVAVLVDRSSPAALATALPAAVRALALALLVATTVVVILGVIVTGSGPHSGDADASHRLPFDVRTVSWMHADSVLFFLGLLVGLITALHLVRAPRRLRSLAWAVLGVSLVQGAIGYGQYFAGVPWLMVVFHVIGAVLLWSLVCLLVLQVRRPRRDATDDAASDAARRQDQGSADERIDRDSEEEQGQVGDRPVEQPHGTHVG